jgi:hypothetical protein
LALQQSFPELQRTNLCIFLEIGGIVIADQPPDGTGVVIVVFMLPLLVPKSNGFCSKQGHEMT